MTIIRNPIEWGAEQLVHGSRAFGSAIHAVHHAEAEGEVLLPAVRKITLGDIRDVLRKGFADFEAYRTDVIFLSVLYPIVGLVLWRAALQYDMLPLLFPLAAGFALVGPVAGIGLYEMSRRNEQGAPVSWAKAFDVVRSPSFGAIVTLGALLLGIFLLWLITAQAIYRVTLGPEAPLSVQAFLHDVFTTGPGWTMIGVGVGVGFLFALVVLAVGAVSFPLLLDRKVGVVPAMATSVRAVAANPGPMAAWGAVVVCGLVLGSIPLFIGLAIVMPVLGHATWHLYRKLIPRDDRVGAADAI